MENRTTIPDDNAEAHSYELRKEYISVRAIHRFLRRRAARRARLTRKGKDVVSVVQILMRLLRLIHRLPDVPAHRIDDDLGLVQPHP